MHLNKIKLTTKKNLLEQEICIFSPHIVCVESTNEVHDSQVKDYVGKNKVCECSFWTDLFELALVGRIDLQPQAS